MTQIVYKVNKTKTFRPTVKMKRVGNFSVEELPASTGAVRKTPEAEARPELLGYKRRVHALKNKIKVCRLG